MPAPPPTPSAFQKGTAPRFVTFGKYLLLEQLAVGGMAEVWLGKIVNEHGVSDLLAVKRILDKHSGDEEFLRMFVDEARLAGLLAHPGIVAIDELGKIGPTLYLAMEYVWGRDLLQILARRRSMGGAFDAVTAAYIAAKMCEALHVAHTRTDRHGKPLGVVHRDVSPQNVLVSFDGRVKLIDFGIAKAASRASKTEAGTIKGKVGYMSPEQVEGASIDHRSDQFAVGTCLYEMLTGRPLFSRPNPYEAMELVREAKIPALAALLPDCPPALLAVATRALAKRPEDRFADAHELQKALMQVVAAHDPAFERIALTAWIRGLFRAEIAEEKRKLDAYDAVGRPPPAPVGRRRSNQSTRLEIGAQDLFDDDEEAETQIFDESVIPRPDPDGRREGAHEVFFQRDAERAAATARRGIGPYQPTPERLAAPGRGGQASGRYARTEDATPEPVRRGLGARHGSGEHPSPLRPLGAETPAPLDHVELHPTHLDTQVLRALLPRLRTRGGPDDTGRMPALRRVQDWISDVGPRGRARDLVLAGALGLAAVLVGAVVTYLVVGHAEGASLEVRTNTPNPALVRIDGVPRGLTPARVEGLLAGAHTLVLEAEGHQPATRSVILAPNSTATIEIALEPVR